MISNNPCFLVAMPELGDPNFIKSVVLMTHQAEDGAMGVAINNPLGTTLDKFARNQGLFCHPSLENVPVFCGGPVQPQSGWILHRDSSVEEKKEIVPGLYLSISKDSLEFLLEKGNLPLKLILGYAGWDEGQLKEEMIAGAWITAPINMTHVFETKEALIWKSVLGDMGIDPTTLVSSSGIH